MLFDLKRVQVPWLLGGLLLSAGACGDESMSSTPAAPMPGAQTQMAAGNVTGVDGDPATLPGNNATPSGAGPAGTPGEQGGAGAPSAPGGQPGANGMMTPDGPPGSTAEPAAQALPPPVTLAEGVEPPRGPDGERTPPGEAEDAWFSYGNGPNNWFANLSERAIKPETAGQLMMKWKIDEEVTAPPVVVGSRVYVTTAEDGLHAFEIEDGTEIWHAPSVNTYSSPAYDPATNTIYVNRFEGSVLHAFDAEDGTLKWSMPVSEQDASRGWSSPVIAGRRLYVGIASSDRGMTFKGGIAAFDLDMEDVAWRYTHAEPQAAGVSIWGGPAADPAGNMVFGASGNNYSLVGSHSDSMFGVDLEAGELMWNQQTAENDRWAYDCPLCGPDHDFGTNPVLFDYKGRELLAAGQKSGSFWLVDRTTGEILWEKKVATRTSAAYGGVLNNGAFDGTRLLVAGNEGARPGTLYALDPDPDGNGRVLWERSLSGLVVGPITTAGGVAFVPVGRTMEVVSCEDGKPITSLPADASVAGSAAVAQGHVFYGSGLSYYDRGAQPGSFYAYGLPEDLQVGAEGPGPGNNPGPGPGNENPGPGPGPVGDGPTFTRVFNDVITGTGCNGGPLCHGGAVGGLLMADKAATYDALVNVPGMGTNTADAQNANCADTGIIRVVPGDPDASLFVQKVDPPGGEPPCGAAMPPTGGLLEREHLDLIRAWIEAGAKND